MYTTYIFGRYWTKSGISLPSHAAQRPAFRHIVAPIWHLLRDIPWHIKPLMIWEISWFHCGRNNLECKFGKLHVHFCDTYQKPKSTSKPTFFLLRDYPDHLHFAGIHNSSIFLNKLANYYDVPRAK
jgi:hypothetical protein